VVLRPESPVSSALTLVLGRRTVAPNRRLKLSGTVTPAGAASRVRVLVQRRAAGVWRRAAVSARAVDCGGAYTWAYRPLRTGVRRVRASAAGVTSRWATFRVRR